MNRLRSASNSPVSLSQAPALRARTVPLRAHTGRSRSVLREVLPRTLAACGCSAFLLTETATGWTLCFALPIRSARAVYWRMVEAGLAFDAESHRELTRLCTVLKELPAALASERPCTIRLEVRFQGERLRGSRTPVPRPAAQA